MSDARTLRGAASGAIAAAVWAALQPIDKRVFGCEYDDVEMLGRLVVGRRENWQAPGLAIHLLNGALFGAVYAKVAPRVPGPGWLKGPVAAVLENSAFWPVTPLLDRHHPAHELIPNLSGSGRALAQATWRHVLFGAVLGELEQRLRSGGPGSDDGGNGGRGPHGDAPPDGPAIIETVYSSNGHGHLSGAEVPPMPTDAPPDDLRS